MEVQDLPSKDVAADNVMESVGVSDAAPNAHEEMESKRPSNESLSVQKRLKAQKRAHEREVRELHQRIGDLESRMTQSNQPSQDQSGQYAPDGNIDDHIHKAVGFALRAKEEEERRARECASRSR